MNYLLKHSKIRISPKIKPVIDEIGRKFNEKFNKLITITSGTRTPWKQADAMYDNFYKEKGTATQKKKYKNQKLFDEIAAAYHKFKIKGRTVCVQEMEKVIKSQTSKKKYISLHLVDSAVDIRTHNLQKKEIDYIIELIKKKSLILSFQDKRYNKNPHIHLQLKPGIVYL